MATLEPREGGGGAEGEPHGAMVAACRVAVDEAWGRLSEVVSGVVDEEDGVFLYKLTRLAQAYPEVTQCVIERREAVVATLVDQLDPVRSSLVSRVQRALLDHSEEQFQLWRAREAARGKVDSEKLETQRVAASMELAHKDLEGDLKLRKSVRAKELHWETKMAAALAKIKAENAEVAREMVVKNELREREWAQKERRYADQMDDLKSKVAKTNVHLDAREKEISQLLAENEGLYALNEQLKGTADDKSKLAESLKHKLEVVRSSLEVQIELIQRQLANSKSESDMHAKRTNEFSRDLARTLDANHKLSKRNEQLDESSRQLGLDLDRSIGEAKDIGREVKKLRIERADFALDKEKSLKKQQKRFEADRDKQLDKLRDETRSLKVNSLSSQRAAIRASMGEMRKQLLADTEQQLYEVLLDPETGVGPRLDQLAVERAALQLELSVMTESSRKRLEMQRKEREVSGHVTRISLRNIEGELGVALTELTRNDERADIRVADARDEMTLLMQAQEAEHVEQLERRQLELGVVGDDLEIFERNFYELRDRLMRTRQELRTAQESAAALEMSNAQLAIETQNAGAFGWVMVQWVRNAAEADIAEITEEFKTRLENTERELNLRTQQLATAGKDWEGKYNTATNELTVKLADAELRATDVLAAQEHLRKILEKKWAEKVQFARVQEKVVASVLEGVVFDADKNCGKWKREHDSLVRAKERKIQAAEAAVLVAQQAVAASDEKLESYLQTGKLVMTPEQAQMLFLLARTNAGVKTGTGDASLTIDEVAVHEAESIRKKLARARFNSKRHALAANRLQRSGSADLGANRPPRTPFRAPSPVLEGMGAIGEGDGDGEEGAVLAGAGEEPVEGNELASAGLVPLDSVIPGISPTAIRQRPLSPPLGAWQRPPSPGSAMTQRPASSLHADTPSPDFVMSGKSVVRPIVPSNLPRGGGAAVSRSASEAALSRAPTAVSQLPGPQGGAKENVSGAGGKIYTGVLAGGGMYLSRLFTDGEAPDQPGAMRRKKGSSRQRRSTENGEQGLGVASGMNVGGGGGGKLDDDYSDESSGDDEPPLSEIEILDPTQSDIGGDLVKVAKRFARSFARCIALESQLVELDVEAASALELAQSAEERASMAEGREAEMALRVAALESHFAEELVNLKTLDNERKMKLAMLAISASLPGEQGDEAKRQIAAIPASERTEADWRDLTAELALQQQEIHEDYVALERGADETAAEMDGRIMQLNDALNRLYHVVSENNPELLFRASELEGLVALRDAQIQRLLEALHAQRRRVSSTGGDLALALSLFPSLAPILSSANRHGEHKGLNNAGLVGESYGPTRRKPRRGGNGSGNRKLLSANSQSEAVGRRSTEGSNSFAEGTDEDAFYEEGEFRGLDEGSFAPSNPGGVTSAECWLLPERNVPTPSLGGLYASTATLLAPQPLSNVRRPATGVPTVGRRALSPQPAPPWTSGGRPIAHDLRPISTGNELHVVPFVGGASRGETLTGWLAADNAYGPRNAPALRPVRPRTTVGLRSMSDHVTAAAEFSTSLKSVSDAPKAPLPARLACDRSFLISGPARATGPLLGAGALSAQAVADLYPSRPTTSSARLS